MSPAQLQQFRELVVAKVVEAYCRSVFRGPNDEGDAHARNVEAQSTSPEGLAADISSGETPLVGA